MAKFKVKVKIIAACEYEVEVDTSTEAKAENTASGLWREKLPEDFQVEKGYISDVETEAEQLTADCPDCRLEHIILHDDLPVCFCNKFGHNPYSTQGIAPRAVIRPHLIVDGICTPEPWWWDDRDYCAACGAKIEAGDEANATR